VGVMLTPTGEDSLLAPPFFYCWVEYADIIGERVNIHHYIGVQVHP
jgi:hypothetical protein